MEIPFEKMRNKDLLNELIKVRLAAEHCLRYNHIDAHNHFAIAKEIESNVLSRMNQPDEIKLSVREN